MVSSSDWSESPLSLELLKTVQPFCLHIRGEEIGPMDGGSAHRTIASSPRDHQIYVWYRGISVWVPVQAMKEFRTLRFSHSEMKPVEKDVLLERAAIAGNGANSRHLSFPVTILIKGPDFSGSSLGIAVDISARAIQVRVEQELRVARGAQLEIGIRVLSLAGVSPLSCVCEVLWNKPRELRLGLRFKKFLDASGESRWHAFLDRLNSLPYFLE